ncbi:hypothetical protein BSLG_006139 [Batrachochytrium salamandrivorans]|nr:hypothetical protein BSLG_006139 [Batrachochytrium salamandrivorans]
MGFAKPTVYNPHQSLCTLSLPSTSQSYSKSLYPISIPLESHYKQQQQEQQQLRIGGMAASAPSHRVGLLDLPILDNLSSTHSVNLYSSKLNRPQPHPSLGFRTNSDAPYTLQCSSAVDPETPNIQYSTPFICQRAWENSPLSRLSVYLLKTYENIKTLNDNEIKRKRSLSTDYDPPKRNKVSTGNNGFDDKNDDYIVREGEVWMGRFQIQRHLGKGSFGQVVCAYDRKCGETVAIKVIKNRRAFTNQALVEIRLLGLITCKDPTDSNFLAMNLYEILKKRRFSGLPLALVRKFALQILAGLQFLSRPDIQIIHCDLKPENIMLLDARKSLLRIIDFGSSCFLNEQAHTYIQSRFYRSPEIMMGHAYSLAIDMWSLGCILVELLTGAPLFPGANEHDQMCRICDIVGMPPSHFIEASPPDRINRMFVSVRSGVYRLLPSRQFKSSNRTLRGIISAGFQAASLRGDGLLAALDSVYQAHFIDLVERILKLDPKERLTPKQALQHAFFQLIPLRHSNARPSNPIKGEISTK